MKRQAVVAGSIAHSGRYSIDEKEKSFTYRVDLVWKRVK
jgi:hypothetical protein